ncbi:MAG: GTPase [Candidatus Pacearchaeota archaeon]
MIKYRFKANRPRQKPNTDITPYWKVLEKIIDESDIVLEVLDARMPHLSRNEELENLIKKKGKHLVFILNKSDLTSKENIEIIKKTLKKDSIVFDVNGRSVSSVKKLRNYLRIISRKKQEIKVGVVGYPNTGKSSIINAITRKKKSKISSRAGTTHGQQWIKFGDIMMIDSPGVIPIREDDEIRLAMIGSKNPEKIKNLEMVASKIIELFKESENLGRYYGIDIKNNNSEEIIESIGRKKGMLKKGNKVDESRVSIMLIRDWQNGKLKLQ